MILRFLTCWVPAVFLCGTVWPQQPVDKPSLTIEVGIRLFAEQIRPILDRHCLTCHSSSSKQGALDLSTRQGMLAGGGRGPALVPGDSRASLLYQLVTHSQEPAMPLGAEPLPAETAALIALWIDLGAPFAESHPEHSSTVTDMLAGSHPSSSGVFVRVQPTLEAKCLNCHGGKFRQAGLDLSTRERLLAGSDEHRDVLVPGDGPGSLLVKKIRHQHEPGMPYQGEPLSEEEIADIVAWVEAGAPYSGQLNADVSGQARGFTQGSDHWAYQAPRRPPVPKVRNQAWVRNPIDAFLSAQHERHGLVPMPQVEKRLLLRRLHLDLTGLPPTPAELQSFLDDRSRDAYEETVDRLLESPHYGERWGRHWMDVWRYSDWYGMRGFNILTNGQRHLWHWRDWIIESLNEDKGYDRMVLEMLAGDELAPTDSRTLRATGYLVRSRFSINRDSWLRETVEHTASAFLATTLKCARCHDHKTDPIAQDEYYSFRAFFEPYDVRTDPLPGEANLVEAGLARVFDSEPRAAGRQGPPIYAETYRYIRGDEKNPDKSNPLSPAVPEILGRLGEPIQPIELPLESYYPSIQPFVHDDLLGQARQAITRAEAGLVEARQEESRAQKLAAMDPDERVLKLGRDHFDKEIKPIFDRNCVVCHGPNVARNDFRTITFDLLLEGGTRDGPGIVPGKSAGSSVIRRLSGDKQPRMPAEAPPLPEEVIKQIADWIDGLVPEDPKLMLRKAREAAALAEKKLTWSREDLTAQQARLAADRAHWADPPDPRAQHLAEAARKAERSASLLKAEMNLLEAQQKLAHALEEPPAAAGNLVKTREKRVSVAGSQLRAAQTALGLAKNEYSPVGTLYPRTSTGRRTALARWITRKENPLTARVAINHIWMRHYGEPLVASIEDFGVKSDPPSHPQLLDWLAIEFMENDWSMKHIHRLMVTSSAYRMQSWPSRKDHPNLTEDRENRYLWRMNQRRMEAEVVRDSILAVAGELDPTVGGPELDHHTGQRSRRRSLYFTHTPNENMPFLKLFDLADAEGCYRRYESIVPQQALALSNSEMSFSHSHLLARKISDKVGQNAKHFVERVFERVLGRDPSRGELEASLKFLGQQTALLVNPQELTQFESGSSGELPPSTDPSLRAREGLVHVLFNRNEFVTIR